MNRAAGVLVLVLVALVVGVSVTSMVDGKRVGAAQARVQIFESQRDAAIKRETVWRNAAARAHADAAIAHAAAAQSHAAATKAEKNFQARLDRDREKPPVVITDTAAVRAELASKDSTISAAAETIAKKNTEIVDKDREIASLVSAHVFRDSVDVEQENRYAALARINSEMRKLVPGRVSKAVTAAKWLTVGYAIGKAIR